MFWAFSAEATLGANTMALLAGLILFAVIIAALWGAVQLAFWIIIGSIAYLFITSAIETIKSWLKN